MAASRGRRPRGPRPITESIPIARRHVEKQATPRGRELTCRGSGGSGDVLERDPQAVVEDVRADRLPNARAYAEFAAEWTAWRPPEQVLKYFGEWPSRAPNRAMVRI